MIIFFFVKKVTMPEKLQGGPFGTFQHPFCRRTSKNLMGDPLGNGLFRKKSLTMPKKFEKETL